MRDNVKIKIGGSEISTFLFYEADSNVLIPADVFSCKISRIENSITTGEKFELLVNDTVEMTGIIDKVSPSYSKGSQEMTIAGRDFMGLLIDSSVNPAEWKTKEDKELKDLAERLLAYIPFVDVSQIKYGNKIANVGISKNKKKETTAGIFGDTSTPVSQISTGQSVFEVLSDYAQRNGLLMWMEPDGALIFGELKGTKDAAEFNFYTYKTGDNRNKNNIISASLTDDISKRYSDITIIGQRQGSDPFEVGSHYIQKKATDKNFPFTKPLVLQTQAASDTAAVYQAQLEVKKREAEGLRIEITVAGHSQDKKNYKGNRVCYIKDEVTGFDGNYLILGRKFTMNKTDGPKTILTIGKLMEGYDVS